MNGFAKVVACLIVGCPLVLTAGTPLSKAARDGDLAKVEGLLTQGEKVNELDKWGWTPLLWAVFYRQRPVTEFLLAHGADPNVRSEDSMRNFAKGTTPLVVAAYYGQADEAALLMAKGAKADLPDDQHKTAMDYAVSFQFQEVVDILGGKVAKAQVPGKPDYGPGVDASALGTTYPSILVAGFNASPKTLGDYPGMVARCEASLVESLSGRKVFAKVERKPAGTAHPEATLLVEVEVTDLRIPSGAARFFVGPLAGASYLHVTLRLKDAATGKLLREQAIGSDNSVWMSSFSLGGHDQDLPVNMGILLADYIKEVAGPKS